MRMVVVDFGLVGFSERSELTQQNPYLSLLKQTGFSDVGKADGAMNNGYLYKYLFAILVA